jgi:heat shock protein HslJ
MKTIFLAPLLALAACQTTAGPYGQGPSGYPEPAPYPPQSYPQPGYPVQGDYRAIGTEPFWDLTIGREMVFTDRGNNIRVAEPTPPVRTGFAGETYQGRRLFVNIVHARCSDGMSDRSYPDTVNVTVDGRAFRGCGANAAFFGNVGENGLSNAVPSQGGFNLANTNWRVVSITGRAVAPGGYYLNFMPDRVSGRFGCNTIGAGYTVEGSTLRAGALMMTRMACENNNLEAEGVAVLQQPMTISESGDRMTLSNRAGTIEMTRAR